MTANVERLHGLLAAGTPGPWRSREATVLMGVPTAGGFDISCCPRPRENAELIAAAVNALPALLHQLAERDAEVDLVRSGLRNRGEYIEGQPPLPLAQGEG